MFDPRRVGWNSSLIYPATYEDDVENPAPKVSETVDAAARTAAAGAQVTADEAKTLATQGAGTATTTKALVDKAIDATGNVKATAIVPTLSAVSSADAASIRSGLNLSGLQTVRGDGIISPANNVTYAAGAAGNLTGAYFYHVTYVTALGETAPWIGQATPVTLASQRMQVTLAAAPAGVIARRLYRSVANGAAPDRAVFFLVEIAGNGATTYDDNAADNTLGTAPGWTGNNRALLFDGLSAIPIARFSDQATTFGQQAGGLTPSYATTAFGYRAGANMAGGTRNTLFGVYAGENMTSARENTAIGTHVLNATVTGTGNVAVGYATGTTRPWGDFNVGIGENALGGTGTTAYGTFNVAVGFQALSAMGTFNRAVGIGAYAGKYADASSQVYIDNQDRGDAAAAKTNSLVYGVGNASMLAQTLAFNAATRVGGKVTVAQLPAASAALAGHRFVVTDANAAYTSANVGAAVAGGGTNVVPVFCNGAAWVIG